LNNFLTIRYQTLDYQGVGFTMYRELFAIIDSHTYILTANQRLAEHLHRQFYYYQQQKNLNVWPSANILAFNTFLIEQWQKHPSASETLLTEHEETLLWQSIVANDDEAQSLLQINNTAQFAKQAWHTLKLWQVAVEDVIAENEEIQHFLTWAGQFEQQKLTQQWISNAELAMEMSQHWQADANLLPEKIILVGFDDFPPAYQHLLNVLRSLCTIIHYEAPSIPAKIQRLALSNQDQEIMAMAYWAKSALATQREPLKIACIVPNLNSIRDKVQRIFTDIFAGDQPEAFFNISAGHAFQQIPMIQAALNVLSIHADHYNNENIKDLLLSPYINSHPLEKCLAAHVEIELANLKLFTITADIIHATLSQLTQLYYSGATLAKRWQQFIALPLENKPHTFYYWAHHIQKLLLAMGWPGQRTLSSHEYQITERWQQLLQDFIKLDQITAPISFTTALSILMDLCQLVIFQPQSTNQPIQILGMLEAAGCEFSQIWLMGLDNESWPPKATPNPFLPIELQRKLVMPHASANRELIYCQQIQQRLLTSSQNIIVSSAQQEKDKALFPSQLIMDIPLITLDSLGLNFSNSTPTSLNLETLQDFYGPALTTENIHGGSQLFQQQSLCPFRAFAQIRLKAVPVNKPTLGIDPIDRGILAHRAMELFWKQTKTQANLLSLNDHELQQRITEILNTITKNLQNSYYLKVEQQRLQRLLTAWLNLEKERPSFRVDQRESQVYIQIGPLKLKIQIDRIDELESEQHLIIDYKTGKKNKIEDWLGDRPLAPQLPIYCIYGSEHTVGLAYAEINLANLKFTGIIHGGHEFSALKSLDKAFETPITWSALKQNWTAVLEKLAEQFYQGYAVVDPQNSDVCEYCHLQGLCRIGENTC